MIESYEHQKEMMHARLDMKTCETMLHNIISFGTNCSSFESEVIVDKAKDVFCLGEYRENNILQPGQLIWLAIDAKEPAGKELKKCKLRRIVVDYHNPEDEEIYRTHGLAYKRQSQIMRMAENAKVQKALLTQEDLSKILGVDVKTVRRDIAALKKRKLIVPTRGQQKDIGPTLTHREIAVRKFLEGSEPLEISRAIKHSIKAVERYVDTFCRVLFCQKQTGNTLQTALIVGISASHVNSYLGLKKEFIKKKEYQNRLEMIEEKGKAYWDQIDFKKKPSQQERRPK